MLALTQKTFFALKGTHFFYFATILSAAMLLRFSAKNEAAARAIETAVNEVLADNIKTADLADETSKVVGTMEMAQEIAARI
mgnify:CR=1 FL=1